MGLGRPGIKTEHAVGNVYVKDMLSPTKARVLSLTTLSVWDPKALGDIKKTFRQHTRAEDIWVCEEGVWKKQYSFVELMGPGIEMPVFGKGNSTVGG